MYDDGDHSSDSSVSSDGERTDATYPSSQEEEEDSVAIDLVAVIESLEFFLREIYRPQDYPGMTADEAFQQYLISQRNLQYTIKEIDDSDCFKSKKDYKDDENIGTETAVQYEDGNKSTPTQKWDGFGERIYDDHIDIFCDRLQRAVREQNRRIDGFMAIQAVLNQSEDEIRPHISGSELTLQVVYDPHRSGGHYVLLSWEPSERVVVIYDSIVPSPTTVHNTLSDIVLRQIIKIFGHTDEKLKIHIRIERNIPRQNDSWSCGLRVLGFLTRISLRLSANGIFYDLEQTRNFLRVILDMPNPTLDDFQYIHLCTSDKRRPKKLQPIWAELNKVTSEIYVQRVECSKKSNIYDRDTYTQ